MCMCLKLKNVRILSVFKVIFPYHDNIACFLVWVCRSRYIAACLQFLALKSPCLLNKYNKKKNSERGKNNLICVAVKLLFTKNSMKPRHRFDDKRSTVPNTSAKFHF